MSKKRMKFQMTEKWRTFFLLMMLVFAIGFIFWTQHQYETNFIESF